MQFRLGFASWSFIVCALFLFWIAQDSGARRLAGGDLIVKEEPNSLQNLASVRNYILTKIIHVGKEAVKLIHDDSDDEDSDDDDSDDEHDDDDSDDEHDDDEEEEEKHKMIGKKFFNNKDHMDPELNVFFKPNDLKIGKKMPIFFAKKKDPSSSPKFLPKQESDKIPFSSKYLHTLLKIFSFPKHSPQAKAMKYTLKQCEYEAMKGETKFCATSLESLLDHTHKIFGPNSESKVVSTLTNSSIELQNYTILEVKEVSVPKVVGCHPMPYPYAVFYCHSQDKDTALYEVIVEGEEDGTRVEAKAICHLDTSKWNTDHVAFAVLKVQPGTSPVCHFFPPDNLIWLPSSSSSPSLSLPTPH